MRIEIPLEGAKAKLDNDKLEITGPKGTVSRIFRNPTVKFSVEGDKVVISKEGEKRRDKRIMFTLQAHIRNMVLGVNKVFRYELALVHSHFPVQMKVQGQEFFVENFYGEKSPRKFVIPAGVKVNVVVKDKKIFVESSDIELAGRTVTLLEQLTRVTGKDKRIFQDGIYLIGRGFAEASK